MHINIPDNVDLDYSNQYQLSIRVHADGCSLALYDPLIEGSYFYHEVVYDKNQSALANFKELFFTNEFLALPYKKVQIMSYSSRFTCMPSVIYDDESKDKILDFNFTKREQRCLSQQLSRPELHIIYDMSEEMYEFSHRSFANPQFIHHISPLISFFLTKSRMGNANKLIVNLQKDSLDVLCFQESGLTLVNNFQCNDVEDAIYYVLYIWKQMKLNQLKDEIIVTGLPEGKEPMMSRLREYIKNIIPYNIAPDRHFSDVNIHNIPFDQLALSLCEL